jgi:hypothetical protein
MPLRLCIAIVSGIAWLCASAAMLMLARGNAMLLNLSAAAARMVWL